MASNILNFNSADMEETKRRRLWNPAVEETMGKEQTNHDQIHSTQVRRTKGFNSIIDALKITLSVLFSHGK